MIRSQITNLASRRLPIAKCLNTSSKMQADHSDKVNKRTKQPPPPTGSSKLGDLQLLISKMRTEKTKAGLPNYIQELGTSEAFKYATEGGNTLQSKRSDLWRKMMHEEIMESRPGYAGNEFDEMIRLTEEGKLWKFPIDNEQGLDEQQKVPFEDHVFFDDLLDQFPKNEYIQTFMQFVTAGLAKNPWITEERKREILLYYKKHFEDRRDLYAEGGFKM